MTSRLEHHQIHAILTALDEAKIVSLDSPIRAFLDPIAGSLAKTGVGGEVGLHILCCDEYAIVTGLTSLGNVADVRQVAGAVRSALGQGHT